MKKAIILSSIILVGCTAEEYHPAAEATVEPPVISVESTSREHIITIHREEVIESYYVAPEVAAKETASQVARSGCLTKSGGVFYSPSGKETWYNLNMSRVVQIMRDMGYSEEEYPYWVREDGCKMLGDYIMCAASFDIRPRGTILETSLGLAIVCDTGAFAATDQTMIDVATDWR